MGSGAETVHETVDRLVATGEKVGVVKVPALPAIRMSSGSSRPCRQSVDGSRCWIARRSRVRRASRCIRTCVTALAEHDARRQSGSRQCRKVIGGRYGLSSKEFTPAMVKGVFDELSKDRPEESFHRRHRGRRDAHQARL